MKRVYINEAEIFRSIRTDLNGDEYILLRNEPHYVYKHNNGKYYLSKEITKEEREQVKQELLKYFTF